MAEFCYVWSLNLNFGWEFKDLSLGTWGTKGWKGREVNLGSDSPLKVIISGHDHLNFWVFWLSFWASRSILVFCVWWCMWPSLMLLGHVGWDVVDGRLNLKCGWGLEGIYGVLAWGNSKENLRGLLVLFVALYPWLSGGRLSLLVVL